jgi:hypothetical protein
VSNGVSSYLGGSDIRMYGVGLASIYGVEIAGVSIDFYGPSLDLQNQATDIQMFSKYGAQYSDLQSIWFTTPRIVAESADNSTTAGSRRRLLVLTGTGIISSYQPVAILSSLPISGGGQLALNLTNAIYFATSSCLDAGQWQQDGLGGCTTCPTG